MLALSALVRRARVQDSGGGSHRRHRLGRGLVLFYGDSVITPAISVLSAVQGLELPDPGLASLVVPPSAVILATLFVVQARGTQRSGSLFGPVMVCGVVVIAMAGARGISLHPGVLAALSPTYAFAFIGGHLRPGVRIPGRRSTCRHRSRGPLRRRGALREGPDPSRLVRTGVPGLDAQLPGPSRPLVARPGRQDQPVLLVDAAVGTPSRSGPRHGRHYHRLAGSDLGFLFDDQASRTTGVPPAHGGPGIRRVARAGARSSICRLSTGRSSRASSASS